jgi:hypothetical protein
MLDIPLEQEFVIKVSQSLLIQGRFQQDKILVQEGVEMALNHVAIPFDPGQVSTLKHYKNKYDVEYGPYMSQSLLIQGRFQLVIMKRGEERYYLSRNPF